jgi:hypothetical protein
MIYLLIYIPDTSKMHVREVRAATTDVVVANRWKAACTKQFDRRSSEERPDSWGTYYVNEVKDYSQDDFGKHPIHLCGPAHTYGTKNFHFTA